MMFQSSVLPPSSERQELASGELGTMLAVTTLLHTMLWLLVTANIHSLPILVTLTMEAICSSEMSDLTRATWHNIPEDGILHGHRNGNLNSLKRNYSTSQ
jgi:hypothetical protein